ncbi:hypothetical protein RvY_04381 [Ramazzottius varieornatus]|uniref:Major facilitator superfamily (MFS) profile domain-containing protein n=1 Tax=Ramazzottius varieornatus TaxID=947166 RepID=A0A1D1US65_RAMVA|nr:hypothetical protein RvY_04381 [Ramazzottius varieornatus]
MGSWNSEITKPLVFSTFTAAFGSSLSFGYHVGVMNAPQTIIGLWIRQVKCRRSNQTVETEHGVSEEKWCKKLDFTGELNMFTDNSELTTLWTLTVALLVAASFFGALCTNIFANKLGRRGTLWWNSILAIVAAAVMGCCTLADSFEMLIVGRFIAGFNMGVNIAVPPMYFNEIAPVSLRGAIGALHETVGVTGVLISMVLGLPAILGNEWGWPIMLALTAVPAIFQLVALPLCPESPRYLFVEKRNETAARHALERLRGTSDVNEEMHEIHQEYELIENEADVTIRDLFRDRFLRRITLIAAGVMMSQQLSGIDAVMFYSTAIFHSAGLVQGNQAVYATIAVGAVNALMTLASVFLVEKAGRKILLLIGYGGMAVLTTLLTIFLLQTKITESPEDEPNLNQSMSPFAIGSTISLLGYIVFFSIGPGAIPWFLVNELFATAPRAAASSVAVGVNRLSSLTVALSFPYIQAAIGEYTFIIFVVILAIATIFTQTCIIETKGKTTEEIQYELQHGKPMRKPSRPSSFSKAGDISYDKVQLEDKL